MYNTYILKTSPKYYNVSKPSSASLNQFFRRNTIGNDVLGKHYSGVEMETKY